MGFYRQRTMWLWRNPDNVTHHQLLSIDQVWWRSTALTWSRWGCRRLADNIWLLAHDNNNNCIKCRLLYCMLMIMTKKCVYCKCLCSLEWSMKFWIPLRLWSWRLLLVTCVWVGYRCDIQQHSGCARVDTKLTKFTWGHTGGNRRERNASDWLVLWRTCRGLLCIVSSYVISLSILKCTSCCKKVIS